MKQLLAIGLAVSLAFGCVDGIGGASDFGATPGGVKDLRLARELISNGVIPPADALLVEAMFAEHDLALDGPACARALCLRAAAGVAPEVDGTPRGWAQIGLSSTIDPETWTRPSTTFVFTVDVSGSMGWGGGTDEYPTPGHLARRLLHALGDELRGDDRVAIVTYGSDVKTALTIRAGSDQGALHDEIDELTEAGSTNMEGGMRRAYEIAAASRGRTAQVRVVVFTDVQPNVGATAAGEFTTMVEEAAALDIHTTVLALGLGIGPTVMRGMASLRGANAYGLTRASDVDEFMAEDYPWFTTPIAYGLRVTASVGGSGWSIDRGLGFPAVDDAAQLGLEAETVFLSRRRGALLVAFAPPVELPEPTEPPAPSASGLAGEFSFAYVEPSGFEVDEVVPFAYDGAVDARGHGFGQHGVARTAALALFTEAMHEAATAYAESPEQAEAIMRAAQARFAADAEALGDADLPVEVELGAALLTLIEARATQGTLYGADW